MGLQDVFFALRLPFDSPQARELSARIAEEIYLTALEASADAGRAARTAPGLRADPGRGAAQLQPDLWGAPSRRPTGGRRCASQDRGDRAAQLAADRHRADGDHRLDRRVLRVHRAAGVQPVQARDAVGRVPAGQRRAGARAEGARAVERGRSASAIKRADGSVQGIAELPAQARELFRTAWELPQRALIDMAAARAPYIDQSQSLNLFLAAPTIGKLSSMYLRVEDRPQDHVLPALAAGDAHRPGHASTEVPARRARVGRRYRRRSPARWRTPRPARHASDREHRAGMHGDRARGRSQRCSIRAWI